MKRKNESKAKRSINALLSALILKDFTSLTNEEIDKSTRCIYVADENLLVFGTDGVLQKEIAMDTKPETVTLGGKNKNVLFITASDSVYAIEL